MDVKIAMFVACAGFVAGCSSTDEPAASFRTLIPAESEDAWGQLTFPTPIRDVLWDQSAWEEWWRDHSAPDAAGPRPDVDLERELVIAVSPGTQSSTCGRQIRIESVTLEGDALIASVLTYLPTPRPQACLPTFVDPVHVVAATPRREVQFVERTDP